MCIVEELETDLNIEKICEEYYNIEKTIGYDAHNKIYLQKSSNNYALIDGFKTDSLDAEKSFKELLIPENYEISKIIKKYSLFRSRFMKLNSEQCYFLHSDRTKRVHIPIRTNKNCLFLINDKVYRLTFGNKLYLIDTRYSHTFINANDITLSGKNFERIHFVAGYDN